MLLFEHARSNPSTFSWPTPQICAVLVAIAAGLPCLALGCIPALWYWSHRKVLELVEAEDGPQFTLIYRDMFSRKGTVIAEQPMSASRLEVCVLELTDRPKVPGAKGWCVALRGPNFDYVLACADSVEAIDEFIPRYRGLEIETTDNMLTFLGFRSLLPMGSRVSRYLGRPADDHDKTS
ncbi:MAG: hypothetical protein AAGI17_00365 [Planctomycetota bacterium]